MAEIYGRVMDRRKSYILIKCLFFIYFFVFRIIREEFIRRYGNIGNPNMNKKGYHRVIHHIR